MAGKRRKTTRPSLFGAVLGGSKKRQARAGIAKGGTARGRRGQASGKHRK